MNINNKDVEITMPKRKETGYRQKTYTNPWKNPDI